MRSGWRSTPAAMIGMAIAVLASVMAPSCFRSSQSLVCCTAPVDVSIEHRVDGSTWVVLREGGRRAFVTKLSDASICDVSLLDEFPASRGQVDFEGDGIPEVVLTMWDGGNRGDWLYVIGKRNGSWSVWAQISTPFECAIRDCDGDGDLDVILPERETSPAEVFYFHKGRFETRDEAAATTSLR